MHLCKIVCNYEQIVPSLFTHAQLQVIISSKLMDSVLITNFVTVMIFYPTLIIRLCIFFCNIEYVWYTHIKIKNSDQFVPSNPKIAVKESVITIISSLCKCK